MKGFFFRISRSAERSPELRKGNSGWVPSMCETKWIEFQWIKFNISRERTGDRQRIMYRRQPIRGKVVTGTNRDLNLMQNKNNNLISD